MIAKQLIPFHGLRAPKLDRHAPLKWALIPFQLLWAMKIAVDLIRLERPDVVVTAGGYVSLPLVWTALVGDSGLGASTRRPRWFGQFVDGAGGQ